MLSTVRLRVIKRVVISILYKQQDFFVLFYTSGKNYYRTM